MKKILVAIIIYFSMFYCSDSVSPENGAIIYSNKFETESDFEGWQGISPADCKNDVPNGESKNSVFVSGGCIVPHAQYVFKDNLSHGYYTVECWGKAYAGTFGGSVSLKYKFEDYFLSKDILFNDSVWTYKISDTLFYDKSNDLTIEMNAGGFVPSAMLIDNLVVKKIK